MRKQRKVIQGGKALTLGDVVEIKNLAVNVGYAGTDCAEKKVLNLLWPPDDWLESGLGNPKLVISDNPLTDEQLDAAINSMAQTVAKRLHSMAASE